MPTTHGSVLEQMDNFLDRVREGELGKEAAANLDLAGDAKSTHPSANVDDGTRPATEGSRSSENEADVKKDVPNSINNEDTKNQAGGSTNFADSQGTESMAADSGLKGNVDTPKKDHSKSMSDKGPGDDTFDNNWDKASSDEQSSLLLKEGNEILAAVAGIDGLPKQADDGEAAPDAAPAADEAAPAADAAAAAPAADAAAAAPAADAGDDKEAQAQVAMYKEAADKYPEDMEAGYTAAAMLAQQLGLGQTKEAADAAEQERIAAVAELCKQAGVDAELFCSFLDGYEQQGGQTKRAGLEELLGGAGGAAGAPAALADEGEAGGEMGAGGEAGMVDPAAAGAEGAPEGMPEGAMGAGGEEPTDEASVEAIAELLDEAGVTAEDLAMALQEAQGGGAGGALGGLEGGPEGGLEGAPAGGLEGGLEGAPAGPEGGEQIPPEALAALGGAGGGMEAAATGSPVITKQGSGSRRAALKKLAAAYLKGGK